MADNFTIRGATEEDAENIYKIHTAAIRAKCSTHYSAEDVNVWVARQEKSRYLPFIQANEILVAERGDTSLETQGQLVGAGRSKNSAFPPAPTNCPWVSEDGGDTTGGEEGRILGFGHLARDTKESDGKTMQIRGLFVDPDCGVKGVGSALLTEMEKRAKELGEADCLIVQSSLNAVEFYKKCGFVALEITTHQMSEQSCLQCHKMMKKL